jgi:hypothetical protein
LQRGRGSIVARGFLATGAENRRVPLISGRICAEKDLPGFTSCGTPVNVAKLAAFVLSPRAKASRGR